MVKKQQYVPIVKELMACTMAILLAATCSGCADQVIAETSGTRQETEKMTEHVTEESTKKVDPEVKKDPASYYEVRPGDPEWAGLSLAEAYERSDIKAEELEGLSTQEVLNICLEYPFLHDMTGFDSMTDAVRSFMAHGEQFRVLSERDDAAKVITEAQKNFQFSASDPEEASLEFYGKESFLFAMIRYFHEEGVVSEEEDQEAEKLHEQYRKEYAPLEGEEVTFPPGANIID